MARRDDLGSLLRRHLEVDLPKDQGDSDWGAPELTPEQLAYAANDTRHLLPLWEKLTTELRSCLGAGDGELLVVADYSQIELRVLAAVAPDEAMLAAYAEGADIHTRTAARSAACDEADVTDEQRRRAKICNFGLSYGMGPRGFVAYARSDYGLEFSDTEAEELIESWFEAYPGVRAWHERRRTDILPHWRKNIPYVATTAAGRKRIIHPLLVEREAKPYEYEQDASRRRRLRLGAMVWRALNLEVQGLCADGLKRAMILAHHRLPAEARQVLSIHDEIVLRVPAPMAETCSSILRDAMVEGMTSALPDGKSVPIEVEPVIVERWGEAK